MFLMIILGEGVPKGRPGKITSSGNRGGEDVVLRRLTLWRIASSLNNRYANDCLREFLEKPLLTPAKL